MTNHSWLLEVFDDIEAYSNHYGLTSVRDAVWTARNAAKSEISDLEDISDERILSILRASQHENFE